MLCSRCLSDHAGHLLLAGADFDEMAMKEGKEVLQRVQENLKKCQAGIAVLTMDTKTTPRRDSNSTTSIAETLHEVEGAIDNYASRLSEAPLGKEEKRVLLLSQVKTAIQQLTQHEVETQQVLSALSKAGELCLKREEHSKLDVIRMSQDQLDAHLTEAFSCVDSATKNELLVQIHQVLKQAGAKINELIQAQRTSPQGYPTLRSPAYG